MFPGGLVEGLRILLVNVTYKRRPAQIYLPWDRDPERAALT